MVTLSASASRLRFRAQQSAQGFLFFLTLAAGLVPGVGAQEAVIEEVTPGKRPQATPTPRPAPPVPVFTAPRLLWKTLLKRIDSAPALDGNFLYLGGGDSLYQLDLGGRVQWTAEVGGQQATPLPSGTRVIAGSDKGQIVAVGATTGKSVWRFAVPQAAPVQASPASGSSLLFCVANNDTLYALTAGGQSRWKFTLSDGTLGYAAPIVDAKDVFLAGETSVYRLDTTTGKQGWRTFLGGKALSTPFVTDDTVFVGGDGTGLTALSRKDGKTLWRFAGTQGDWFGPPLVARGTVYVTTFRRYVYALDAKTGAVKWQARLSGSALARPAVDSKRSTVYVTCATFADNPTLVALDTRSGKSRWDFRMGYVSGGPLVASDRLYVGSTTGYLYAFSLR